MARRTYSDEFRREVVREIQCGMSLKRASRIYDVDRNTVRKWVERECGSVRQSSFQQHGTMKEEVAKMIREGNSRRVVAEHLGVSVTSITRWMQRLDTEELKRENTLLQKRIDQLEARIRKYEAV